MKITGIIAEYNPFHNGHSYHLKRAREETCADYLIVVMSGNFVQRGAPALLDKFTRAEMALCEGADLILELPPLWSCASAEYFASASVHLLAQLGCVDTLSYGCETPGSPLFSSICSLLCNETEKYRQLLGSFLKQGDNYALAREKTVLALLPQADAAAASDILKNPNNTLALEYQKAVAANRLPIKIHPVQRQGAGHHAKHLSGPFASASAIRSYLAAHPDVCLPNSPLRHAMPPASFRLLTGYQAAYPLLFADDCSGMLHYALLEHAAAGYSRFADCPAGLSNKIIQNLDAYTGFSQFCTLLKSKNLAYTRISRTLLHILLKISQSDYDFWRSQAYIPYARVLGFRRPSEGLFSYIRKHSAVPLLARAADAKKILPKETGAYGFFEKNLFADRVYRALLAEKGGQAMRNEFCQQVRIR